MEQIEKTEAELQASIALTMCEGIGPVTAKKLIAHCGSASGVFREKADTLGKIPEIPAKLSAIIKEKAPLKRAEREMTFIQRRGVRTHIYWEADYPERLRACSDGPVLLYSRGKLEIDPERTIAVIGTRKITPYGKDICRSLLEGLKESGVQVVSGLAYGVDIQAHREALKVGLPTVGVLAHGTDRIYPTLHLDEAEAMKENGGLITEFPSGTNPDRENFPKRNRIIAGLTDASVIVESGEKGGAMITASLADSYDRDVFTFPGKTTDERSRGCNKLIKQHRAALIETAEDLLGSMNWVGKGNGPDTGQGTFQATLFPDLTPEERSITEAIREHEKIRVDELCAKTGMKVDQAMPTLLDLELRGIVKALPGKVYALE